MECEKCGEIPDVKIEHNYITIMCKCRCVMYKPNGNIKVIPIENYRADYKKSYKGDRK